VCMYCSQLVIQNHQSDFRSVRHTLRLQHSIFDVDACCYEIGGWRTSHAQLLMSALEIRIEWFGEAHSNKPQCFRLAFQQ
jgi:hypothetical protein